MDIQKLKPCPFCGSKDVEAFAQDEDDCPYQSAIVRCFNCDAQTAQMAGKSKIEMAIRAWNKRAAPPEPVKLPGCVDDLHGIGPVMSADAVVEALKVAGVEVQP